MQFNCICHYSVKDVSKEFRFYIELLLTLILFTDRKPSERKTQHDNIYQRSRISDKFNWSIQVGRERREREKERSNQCVLSPGSLPPLATPPLDNYPECWFGNNWVSAFCLLLLPPPPPFYGRRQYNVGKKCTKRSTHELMNFCLWNLTLTCFFLCLDCPTIGSLTSVKKTSHEASIGVLTFFKISPRTISLNNFVIF